MRPVANDEQSDGGPAKVSRVRLGLGNEPAEDDVSWQTAERLTDKYIGTLLKGKWRVERLLGFGGMAFVFAARHRNGRRVALKCMRPELVLHPTLVERFVREGYVANTIEHPGAVAILDDDVMDDGTPFLVMELLSGMTLRERVAHGPLDLGEALSLTAQVLEVVVAAHAKGIVHRDLKPDNLFLTEEGAVKVLDFGIARLKDRVRPGYETESGCTMGTVGFMAPEQARGSMSEVDAQSDVWSIGATLFTLLTGTLVNDAESTNAALFLAMTRAAPPMESVVPWLPRPVQELLDGALAFDKAERFSTARAMLGALEAARAAVGTMVVRPAPPRRDLPSPETPAEPMISTVKASPTLVARVLARRGAVPSGTGGGPSRRTYAALAAGATILLVGGVGLFSLGETRPTHGAAPTSNAATVLPQAPAADTALKSTTSEARPSSATRIDPAAVGSSAEAAPRPPRPEGEGAAGPRSSAPAPSTGTAGVAPPNAPPKKRRLNAPSPSPASPPGPADTRDPLGVRN